MPSRSPSILELGDGPPVHLFREEERVLLQCYKCSRTVFGLPPKDGDLTKVRCLGCLIVNGKPRGYARELLDDDESELAIPEKKLKKRKKSKCKTCGKPCSIMATRCRKCESKRRKNLRVKHHQAHPVRGLQRTERPVSKGGRKATRTSHPMGHGAHAKANHTSHHARGNQRLGTSWS